MSSMQYSVSHQTVFHFDSAPQSVVQRLHLTPLSHANQNVIEWDVKVDGGDIQLGSDDFHGNRIHLCEHDLSGPTMAVSCHGYVEVFDGNGIWGKHENSAWKQVYAPFATNICVPLLLARRLPLPDALTATDNRWSVSVL